MTGQDGYRYSIAATRLELVPEYEFGYDEVETADPGESFLHVRLEIRNEQEDRSSQPLSEIMIPVFAVARDDAGALGIDGRRIVAGTDQGSKCASIPGGLLGHAYPWAERFSEVVDEATRLPDDLCTYHNVDIPVSMDGELLDGPGAGDPIGPGESTEIDVYSGQAVPSDSDLSKVSLLYLVSLGYPSGESSPAAQGFTADLP